MFTIFSKPNCLFCDKAKMLLTSKQINFKIINLDIGQPKEDGAEYISRDELVALIPTAKTMPQILFNGTPIGGFKELEARFS